MVSGSDRVKFQNKRVRNASTLGRVFVFEIEFLSVALVVLEPVL